jgi:N-acetylglucosaminyldiphosphoundecaprenol N-acetyl-beta-D-mannosaminyltransferase
MNQDVLGPGRFRQILGIRFFTGDAQEALARMKSGGLLVAPSGPALLGLSSNPQYREALLNSDLAITDSAMMVLVWNYLQRDNVNRVSGLEYFRILIEQPWVHQPGECFWIMASPKSAQTNLKWLKKRNISATEDDTYIAPYYNENLADPLLLKLLKQRRPENIIVTLGGGTQERLGLYLKRNLNYRPAIHCVGAAIAFLSGDQVYIPRWADRFRVGWLFRCISSPVRYVPRYWGARSLFGLLAKYRDRLPLEKPVLLKKLEAAGEAD